MNGHVSPFGAGRRNDNLGERPQNNYGGGGPRHDSGPRESFGYGVWRDGQHVVGGRNVRLEKELYGDAEDPSKQHTGINFEKYDDIPVEATGAGVPEAVTAFTSPPLDPVLVGKYWVCSATLHPLLSKSTLSRLLRPNVT